jgi:hypothetical protein
MTIIPQATPPITTPWVPLWPLDTGGSYTTCGLTPVVQDGSNVTAEGEDRWIDAQTRVRQIAWEVPSNYVSGPMTLKLALRAGLAGTAKLVRNMYRFRDNAAYFTIEAGVNWDTVFSDTSTHYIFVSVAAGNFQAGDTIRVDVTRNAGDAGDTINSILILDGVSVTYTGLVSNTLGYALPYATTLPTSPTDGQVAVLVDNVINPTYQWQFRYNAASTSAYKWEFIGGSLHVVAVETSELTSSITSTDLATVGPSFTVPRAGDWHVEGVAACTSSISPSITSGGFTVQGTSPLLDAKATVPGAGAFINLGDFARCNGVAASQLWKMQYAVGSGGGTGTFARRRLTVQPIRVS